MPTRKRPDDAPDELRAEYDLTALGPGVRGKYFERATAGGNLVLLDPDVARSFPTREAVNNALRMLVELAETATAPSRSRRKNGTRATSRRPSPSGQ
jgi:hypothetical protein